MSRLTTRALLSSILTVLLIPGWAAGPSIGVATAPGTFQLDGSPVTGNATLFDGAAVETLQSSSRLQVTSGARVELAPRSRAKVYGKYVALEKGSGDLQSARKYQMEARSLRIEPTDPKATARVRLQGQDSVLVAAVNGRVRVFNNAGLVVADVIPGVALSFVPQAGPADASALAGCLTKTKDGAYMLKDDKSGVVVELRGDNLEGNQGKRVEVKGAAFRSAEPAPGASSVIRVNELTASDDTGCSGPSTTAPAAAAAKAAGGMSSGTKVLIAVLVGGGAAGGIVAATAGKSKSPN